MNATAATFSATDFLRPVLRLAMMAFMIGFLGVMAVKGTGLLIAMGGLPGPTHTAAAATDTASPADVSTATSTDWNFPKSI